MAFRAICLACHLAVNRAQRLMTFPPEYALFVARCIIIAFQCYDPMRKILWEFGTSPAAQRTGGEAGKTISRWGAASQSVQDDTEADARAKLLMYLVEHGLLTLEPL